MRRSQLYVPGNNRKMILKAAALPADSVILDLEDAVPPDSKADARAAIVEASRGLDWGKKELCVRINPPGTTEFRLDLVALSKCGRVDCVVVPKAEGDCSSVASKTRKKLIPVVESAKGLMRVRQIAASAGAVAISYGAADFAASVGGSVTAYLDNASIKTAIVVAASEAGIDAVDNVFFDLNDSRGFRKQARASRALGFVGKQVVHPKQVGIANEVFTPSGEEIDWAVKVVAELRRAGRSSRGAIRVDGELVDAVHLRLAKGIIERAKGSGVLPWPNAAGFPN